MTLPSTEPRRIRLLAGQSYSHIQHEVQVCDAHVIAACCGRRVGKTRGMGAPKVARWMHQDLDELSAEVAAGIRPRWAGEGLPRKDARYIQPDVIYWVVAPRESHLDEARGYIRQYYTGEGERFLHPTLYGLYNKGKNLYVQQGGVVGRYDFICAASETGMVSKGLRGAWLDECGFIPNERYNALKPALWDFGGRIIATGTPSFGEDHWFTKLAQSGIPEGHPRYDPRDYHSPRVQTFIADTIHHAFLQSAREGALEDMRYFGPIWAAQWVWADWRRRVLSIYREWSDSLHLADVRQTRRGIELNGVLITEPPDYRDCTVDWSGGTAPGAAVVELVWRSNPLNEGDPRPLVVAVEDYEGHDAYTQDGWWRVLREFDTRWGIDRYRGDPHSPRLIERANDAGIPMEEGAYQDKGGRITLVAGLLHYDREQGIPPAYYVSKECRNLPRQFANYRWRVSRGGEVTTKPKQYDDHCLDCVAMHSAEVYDGGGTRIGGTVYR